MVFHYYGVGVVATIVPVTLMRWRDTPRRAFSWHPWWGSGKIGILLMLMLMLVLVLCTSENTNFFSYTPFDNVNRKTKCYVDLLEDKNQQWKFWWPNSAQFKQKKCPLGISPLSGRQQVFCKHFRIWDFWQYFCVATKTQTNWKKIWTHKLKENTQTQIEKIYTHKLKKKMYTHKLQENHKHKLKENIHTNWKEKILKHKLKENTHTNSNQQINIK